MSGERNRRGFLKLLIDPPIQAAEGLRSVHDREEGMGLLRAVDLTANHGSEMATLAFLWKASFEASKDQFVTVTAESTHTYKENSELLQQTQDILSPLINKSYDLSNALTALASTWRSLYHKSREEIYTYTTEDCTGSGSTETCETTSHVGIRTVYYWDEPERLTAQGITHEAIDAWNEGISGINHRFNTIATSVPSAVPISLGEQGYEIKVTAVDEETINRLRLGGFVVLAGVFGLYEEAIGLIERQEGYTGILDSQQGIKRRSFFKIFEAYGASTILKKIHTDLFLQNTSLEQDVKKNTTRVLGNQDTSPQNTLLGYMGYSVEQIATNLSSISHTQEMSLEMGNGTVAGWERIAPAIRDTLAPTHEFQALWKKTFPDSSSIPKEISSAIKSISATDQIISFAKSRSDETNNSLIQELLILAGMFTGSAIANEVVVLTSEQVINDRMH